MAKKETMKESRSSHSPTVLAARGLIRGDASYKFYTKKYGKSKIRIWNSVAAAAADAKNLRRQGYKVRLTPDKKSAIIIGKTTRGHARTATGQRAVKLSSMRASTSSKFLPRKKPYTPTGYATFRQPSFTLRKLGWEN